MAITPGSFSRFLETDPVKKDGIETFGLWVRQDFLKREDLNEDDLITLNINQRFAGRPDLIALNNYGTSLLEWVVIMFNRPLNPLGWPLAGSVIQIPERSLVRQFT